MKHEDSRLKREKRKKNSTSTSGIQRRRQKNGPSQTLTMTADMPYRKAAALLLLLSAASSAWSFSFAPSATTVVHHRTLYRPKLVNSHPYSSYSGRNRASIPLSNSAAAAITDDDDAIDVTTTTTSDENRDPPLFEPFLQGVRRDYSMRLPLYKSDITDGLNAQCLAATLFLFFACIAPAVGFGSLFGTATHGAIGTMEMVSRSLVGIIFLIANLHEYHR